MALRKYSHLLINVAKLEPGVAYLAVKGQDFDCEPESFRGVVYQLAAEKGMGWKGTTVITDAKTVVYAFYRSSDYMRPNLPAYPIVQKMYRRP